MLPSKEIIDIPKFVENIFRLENCKIISVLTRVFGAKNLDLAEDAVQEALLQALSLWEKNGIPDNPSAWIFKVAKNKIITFLNRKKFILEITPEITKIVELDLYLEPQYPHQFSEKEIQDDLLKMIFTCCHPAISSDSQIVLILKTLCGFTVSEISYAFLTTKENITKRLTRARQKIRESNFTTETPCNSELENRLHTVLETIYLIFNEGYSASNGNEVVRYKLCEEAILLTHIIVESNCFESKGNTLALLSMMYLNASRFKSRLDKNGNLVSLQDQDRKLWDKKMISKGLHYLGKSFDNNEIGLYHLLASISAEHCIAEEYVKTDWVFILKLYNFLIEFDTSPIILLNRAVVISKVNGVVLALKEMEKLKEIDSFKTYHLYYSILADFYIETNDITIAILHLKKALSLAPLQLEKNFLFRRIQVCENLSTLNSSN